MPRIRRIGGNSGIGRDRHQRMLDVPAPEPVSRKPGATNPTRFVRMPTVSMANRTAPGRRSRLWQLGLPGSDEGEDAKHRPAGARRRRCCRPARRILTRPSLTRCRRVVGGDVVPCGRRPADCRRTVKTDTVHGTRSQVGPVRGPALLGSGMNRFSEMTSFKGRLLPGMSQAGLLIIFSALGAFGQKPSPDSAPSPACPGPAGADRLAPR